MGNTRCRHCGAYGEHLIVGTEYDDETGIAIGTIYQCYRCGQEFVVTSPWTYSGAGGTDGSLPGETEE